jgi:cysteine desulfurase
MNKYKNKDEFKKIMRSKMIGGDSCQFGSEPCGLMKDRMQKLYFDNNATTFVPDEVIREMGEWIACGNPSNTHHVAGRIAKMQLEKTFKTFSDHFGVKQSEIIFTSGASEANNIGIEGIAEAIKQQSGKFGKSGKPHIISSEIEHKCLLGKLDELSKSGFSITYIRPDRYGFINPSDIEKEIRDDTILITIIGANNETGVINDLKEIGRIARTHNIAFHSDLTQYVGKYLFNPNTYDLTSFSVSFHKFHGPKGSGLLYIKEGTPFKHKIHGTQNDGRRGGTENLAGVVGGASALRFVFQNKEEPFRLVNKRMLDLKKYILQRLRNKHIDYFLFGPQEFLDNGSENPLFDTGVLPNTLLIAFPKHIYCNGTLVDYLDREYKISCSVGSACNTSSSSVSHVIKSITSKITDQDSNLDIFRSVIRISLGRFNTEDECNTLITGILSGIALQKKIISDLSKSATPIDPFTIQSDPVIGGGTLKRSSKKIRKKQKIKKKNLTLSISQDAFFPS